jgi:nucleoside-diphosphate-sugar epimerase
MQGGGALVNQANACSEGRIGPFGARGVGGRKEDEVKVLVTGGTGVVGSAAVGALLRGGHRVRLFSRGAAEDVRAWPAEAAEARPGNVTQPDTVRGAAEGCDAVLHIVGIVAERGRSLTYERVNVEGTRHIVEEAERAGVRRLVYVSSLGAERGESEYHKSKLAAERVVRGFRGEWVIVRLGNVYGPGDEVLSLLLQMVRTLPAVPVLAGGDQRFQPIWHEDAGAALAAAVERDDVGGEVLELAGPEPTTMNEVLERFAEITGRDPVRIPLPLALAQLGAKAADAVGIELPINESQLTMLIEENTIDDPHANALTQRFGIRAKPLSAGLVALADAQPEQTPDEGVGKLKYRIVTVDIVGARGDAVSLFESFRDDFGDFVPIDATAEPGTDDRLEAGATVTMALPLRGTIQVRVEEAAGGTITVATLEGHPLAGAVRFSFRDVPGAVRFTINVADRPATRFDYVAMLLGGNVAQRRTWIETAERVVAASGGRAPDGVKHVVSDLDDESAEPVEDWLRELINRRKREEATR